jgi:hypothetical protein
VTSERIAEFKAVERSFESEEAFDTYCDVVKSAAWRVPKKVAIADVDPAEVLVPAVVETATEASADPLG